MFSQAPLVCLRVFATIITYLCYKTPQGLAYSPLALQECWTVTCVWADVNQCDSAEGGVGLSSLPCQEPWRQTRQLSTGRSSFPFYLWSWCWFLCLTLSGSLTCSWSNEILISLNIVFLSNHIHALCCLVSFCPRSLGSVSVTGTSSLMDWSDSPMTTDSTSYTKKAPSIGFYRSSKLFFYCWKNREIFSNKYCREVLSCRKGKETYI